MKSTFTDVENAMVCVQFNFGSSQNNGLLPNLADAFMQFRRRIDSIGFSALHQIANQIRCRKRDSRDRKLYPLWLRQI